MATGSERRDVVNDPNARVRGSFEQRQQIAGAPVVTPKGADFSGVGQKGAALSKMFESASGAFQSWYQKKIEKWQLEGQMAFAAGKTEAEITSQGNRFTQAGYMNMKARTAYNEWAQTAMDQIAQGGDDALDSDTYRKKLSDTWTAMVEQTSGKDPYTKNLMARMAEESFPKLVAQQVKANNALNEQRTFQSRTEMLVSEAARIDPTESPDDRKKRLSDLIDLNPGGLSEERRKESNVAAAALAQQNGDRSLYLSLGFKERQRMKLAQAASTLPRGLLSAAQLSVMDVESGGRRYNADGSVVTSPKGAKGEMQVMDATNKDPGYGVRPAQDDSLEERRRVGEDYLTAMINKYPHMSMALMAYNAGPGAVDAHIAKVGDPSKGEISIEEFVKQFGSKETRDYVSKVTARMTAGGDRNPDMIADELDDQYATMRALMKEGYTPAQIESLANSDKQFQDRKSAEFNKSRLLAEQSITDQALLTGNYSAALDQISKVKEENGYSDAWAVRQANAAESAVQTYKTKTKDEQELALALATGTVRSLSASNQNKAVDRYRVQAAAELRTQGVNLATEEGQEQLKSMQRNMLSRNGVVDEAWKGEISSALNSSSTRLTKDGQVSPEALTAYRDWQNFAKSSSPGYADQYLDGDEAKAIVALASTYDTGLNSEAALRTAIDQVQFKSSDRYSAPKTVSQDAVNKIANKKIDELDPGFWAFFSSNQAENTFAVSDDDVARAKANPALNAAITSEANRILASDTTRALTAEAAVNQAMKNIQGRIEMLPGGNLVFGGRNSTIRADMGYKDATQTNFLHRVMSDFMSYNGKAFFGSLYVGKTENADEQYNMYRAAHPHDNDGKVGDPRGIIGATKDMITGTPDNLYFNYNPDSKSFTVDLWVDDEDGNKKLLGNPVSIPAAYLGAWQREREAQERAKPTLGAAAKNVLFRAKQGAEGLYRLATEEN